MWCIPLYATMVESHFQVRVVNLFTRKLRWATEFELIVGKVPPSQDYTVDWYVVAYDSDRRQIIVTDDKKVKALSVTEFKMIVEKSDSHIHYCTPFPEVGDYDLRPNAETHALKKLGILSYFTLLNNTQDGVYKINDKKIARYTRLPKKVAVEAMKGFETCVQRMVVMGLNLNDTDILVDKFHKTYTSAIDKQKYPMTRYDYEPFWDLFIEFVMKCKLSQSLLVAIGKSGRIITPHECHKLAQETRKPTKAYVGDYTICTKSIAEVLLYETVPICESGSTWEIITKTQLTSKRVTAPCVYLYPTAGNEWFIDKVTVHGYYEKILFAPMQINKFLRIEDSCCTKLDLSMLTTGSQVLDIMIENPRGLEKVILPKQGRYTITIRNTDTATVIYGKEGKIPMEWWGHTIIEGRQVFSSASYMCKEFYYGT